MAIEQVIRCDLCGELLVKRARFRIAVRRDEDRPESAEYLDIGPCCVHEQIALLVKLSEEHRPEDASGYKA